MKSRGVVQSDRELLNPFDIIEGAHVSGHPGLYVIGSYDSRITFYSQQVRAIELAYALKEQGHLRDNLRIGVIGAGAAGITIAAAIALISNAAIDLYEKADDILPLQRATARRNLDPHIYDWPAFDADHAFADLPLLDWRAGPSRDVRTAVMREFGSVVDAVAPRIVVHKRHQILGIEQVGASFDIEFERDRAPGDLPAAGTRIRGNSRVDLVFLSFGFGLEPEVPFQGVPTLSYWSDGGVPGPDLGGRTTPRFLISGNGDGGLIDLVAAASANFDHSGMIRSIVHQAGIDEIFGRLEEIDIAARKERLAGRGFDFIAAYDVSIDADLARLGLYDQVRRRLRPGVQLTLQTLHAEALAIETATLNRLAAYLVIKVCSSDGQAGFRHVHCANVVVAVQPVGAPDPAPYWFDCDGELIGVDSAIVRRGPDRAGARAPFQKLLGAFNAEHDTWLRRHGAATAVPYLSDGARELFEAASRTHAIPLPRHVQDAMASRLPTRVQVRPAGVVLRWSGGFAPADASQAWSGSNGTEIYCPTPPDTLGPVTLALARLAVHADSSVIFADAASWRPILEAVSGSSRHADGLMTPRISPLGAEGAIQHPVTLSAKDLSGQVHQSLDRWMLDAIDLHLIGYLTQGRDPANRIGFRAAPQLKAIMQEIWIDWRARFRADPTLLGRFLRLTVCALDGTASVEEAYVLVGPRKLMAMTRSTAVALAIAVGWEVMAPHPLSPGNLARTIGEGPARTGHTCAADRIDGAGMAVCAAKFMWKTNFVVLPFLSGPVFLAVKSGQAFANVEDGQPRLTDADGRTHIVITVDESFVIAVETGPDALIALLTQVEEAHFRRLAKLIEKAGT